MASLWLISLIHRAIQLVSRQPHKLPYKLDGVTAGLSSDAHSFVANTPRHCHYGPHSSTHSSTHSVCLRSTGGHYLFKLEPCIEAPEKIKFNLESGKAAYLTSCIPCCSAWSPALCTISWRRIRSESQCDRGPDRRLERGQNHRSNSIRGRGKDKEKLMRKQIPEVSIQILGQQSHCNWHLWLTDSSQGTQIIRRFNRNDSTERLTFRSQEVFRSRLDGFRSRWSTFAEWMYLRPRRIW